jgi:hypothetical protein
MMTHSRKGLSIPGLQEHLGSTPKKIQTYNFFTPALAVAAWS